ncbi:hypothetical protein [Nocardia sp. NPDC052316]|uniref:Rv0361 family membrane protein n=1 Tax=Nocardia sp. NPDC052316 TaxID=3364329 RepID=UPI0037CC4F71
MTTPTSNRTRGTTVLLGFLTLAAALVAGVLIGRSTHERSETPADQNSVAEAVRTVVDAANTGDTSTLSRRTCGDVGMRVNEGNRQILANQDTDTSTLHIGVGDFHYITVDGNTATAYARVQGKLGTAEGTPQVAFFALVRDDNDWKLCTATISQP